MIYNVLTNAVLASDYLRIPAWVFPDLAMMMRMDAAPKSRRSKLSRLVPMLAGLMAASGNLPAEEAAHFPLSQLKAAAAYSATHAGEVFVAMQHGKVIFEDYPNGGGRDLPHRIYSGTKGFWGLAALAAAEEGIIDVDERVSNTITEWREDPRKARITIRQLWQMTSGLERCILLHEDGLANRNATAIGRPLQSDPGKSFIYGPSSLQVFEELLKRKLAKRRELPTHYLERHVLHPLGLGPQRYLPDRSGNPLLAAGFMMTGRDWAGIGQVLLRHGKPIIKPESMDLIRHGSTANAAFSFGFWNNTNASHHGAVEPDIEKMLEGDWYKHSWTNVCLCRSAPPDLLAAIGSHFQRLYVSPQHDLVVVRMGSHSNYQDSKFLRLLFGE
ncbi:MAG: Beta-lactamase [Verrucomicrobiaceae bacterium]|nr:Beta-lactamase [Verrucomicrobiaceae bacterium]